MNRFNIVDLREAQGVSCSADTADQLAALGSPQGVGCFFLGGLLGVVTL
jgi:hypothetical protein